MKKRLLLSGVLLLAALSPQAALAQRPGIRTDCGSLATGSVPLGGGAFLSVDSNGKLCISGSTTPTPPSSSSSIGITPVVSGSAVSSSVLKNAPGNLYGVYATCTAACWLMVFNATSAPVNGATTAGNAAGNLVECIPIGAAGVGGANYPLVPAVYSTGITAMISSTGCATLTASAVGFIHGMVQ
jgi:hypothetical protein